MNTMVLPENYVELEQEEMMYLDAGWSRDIFIKNAINLSYKSGIGWIGRSFWNYATNYAGAGYWNMISDMGATAARVFWALPVWAQVAGLAAGAAVIFAMGTWYIF